MPLVMIGVFVMGLSMSALAALYVPRKKPKFGDPNAPRVITSVQVKGKCRNEYR